MTRQNLRILAIAVAAAFALGAQAQTKSDVKVDKVDQRQTGQDNKQFLDLGNGTYKLMNRASGALMLDDPAGSTTAGTQLQIWTDNGLAPQQWVLQ